MDDGRPTWAERVAADVAARRRAAESFRRELDEGIEALERLEEELAILDASEHARRLERAEGRVCLAALLGRRLTMGSAVYRASLRRRYPWWRRLVVLWPWWP